MPTAGLKIESVPLSDLREDPRNARKHSVENLKAISDSLRHHGQVARWQKLTGKSAVNETRKGVAVE